MQEEIENKTLSLIINTSKFTERTLATAFAKALKLGWNKAKEHHQAKPQGRQSVKQLIGQNQGVSTVESNDPDIKAFDRIARKYGVDYAVRKVRTPDKPKYVIFFKARDSDALKQAFSEYADKVTTQKERKPSVLQKLRDYVAVVQNRVLERSKDKQKGQER